MLNDRLLQFVNIDLHDVKVLYLSLNCGILLDFCGILHGQWQTKGYSVISCFNS